MLQQNRFFRVQTIKKTFDFKDIIKVDIVIFLTLLKSFSVSRITANDVLIPCYPLFDPSFGNTSCISDWKLCQELRRKSTTVIQRENFTASNSQYLKLEFRLSITFKRSKRLPKLRLFRHFSEYLRKEFWVTKFDTITIFF